VNNLKFQSLYMQYIGYNPKSQESELFDYYYC